MWFFPRSLFMYNMIFCGHTLVTKKFEHYLMNNKLTICEQLNICLLIVLFGLFLVSFNLNFQSCLALSISNNVQYLLLTIK